MKRHFFGAVGALAVVALLAGCKSDPTASLRGGVDRVVISRTYVELDVGQTITVNAKSYDEQGNVLMVLPEVSVSDAAIATVTVDTVTSGDPLPQTDFVIEAVAPGQVEITATAGGVSSDPTAVISFPTVFGGTIAASPLPGDQQDQLTISGTSVIGFDEETEVLVGGVGTPVLSVASDQIVVAAIAGGTGLDVVIEGALFLGDFRVTSLPASATVDARGTPFASSVGDAGDVTAGPFPMTLYVEADHDNAPDWFVKLAPTAADLPVTVTLSWDTDDDIDILWYDDAGDCCYFNFDGATGANPEVSSATIPAGFAAVLNVNSYAGGVSFIRADITSP